MSTIEFTGCRGIKETALAVLVDIPGIGEKWIPKSQIDDDSEVWEEGNEGTLVITEWFALERGLV